MPTNSDDEPRQGEDTEPRQAATDAVNSDDRRRQCRSNDAARNASVLGLPTIWGLCGWFFSAAESGESGLKNRGIWGQRSLRWDEIKEWGYNGFCYSVRGSRATLRYGIVADFGGLEARLKERAPDKQRAAPLK